MAQGKGEGWTGLHGGFVVLTRGLCWLRQGFVGIWTLSCSSWKARSKEGNGFEKDSCLQGYTAWWKREGYEIWGQGVAVGQLRPNFPLALLGRQWHCLHRPWRKHGLEGEKWDAPE